MSKENRIFDLEERLIDFAVRIIRTAESLPKPGREITLPGNSFAVVHHPRPIMVKLKAQNLVLPLYT